MVHLGTADAGYLLKTLNTPNSNPWWASPEPCKTFQKKCLIALGWNHRFFIG